MGLDATVYSDDDCNESVLSHHLGNVANIAALHNTLRKTGLPLRITLGKILYSGSHCGDELSTSDVCGLVDEIELMSASAIAKSEDFVQGFCRQMSELADCALRLGRPIVF